MTVLKGPSNKRAEGRENQWKYATVSSDHSSSILRERVPSLWVLSSCLLPLRPLQPSLRIAWGLDARKWRKERKKKKKERCGMSTLSLSIRKPLSFSMSWNWRTSGAFSVHVNAHFQVSGYIKFRLGHTGSKKKKMVNSPLVQWYFGLLPQSASYYLLFRVLK